MARTLIANVIKKDENATEMSVDGIAKSHLDLNMQTATINDSLNISSITDHSTGNFSSAKTNAYESVNYFVVAGGIRGTASNGQKWDGTVGTEKESTSSVRLRAGYVDSYSGAISSDYLQVNETSFGDLA